MINRDSFKLSIIVPCYNEKSTINIIIEKIIKSLNINKFANYEIIIVDDHSKDGTIEILNKFGLKDKIKVFFHESNLGKGAAIHTALKHIDGDITIIQDADLEYDPSEYPKLINPIINDVADVVYGSRFVGSGEKRILNYWHSVGNLILTQLSNMFTNLNLSDMENCYKVFRSEIIKDIDLKENRFGFEPEITAKISKKQIRIYEVGVKYYGRGYNEGKKINWKDGVSAIRCIFYYNLFSK